jgi:hypothetical protein
MKVKISLKQIISDQFMLATQFNSLMEIALSRALRVTIYHGHQINYLLSEQEASISQGYPSRYCGHGWTRRSKLCYSDSLTSWNYFCLRNRTILWISLTRDRDTVDDAILLALVEQPFTSVRNLSRLTRIPRNSVQRRLTI